MNRIFSGFSMYFQVFSDGSTDPPAWFSDSSGVHPENQTTHRKGIPMKKTIAWLVLGGILLAGCGSPAPATATQPSTTAAAVSSSTPTGNHSSDVLVASKMAGILFDMESVQKNLDDDTTALAKTTLDTSTILAGFPVHLGKLAMPPASPLVQIGKVPQGFLDPLPESGAIPGEAGSCGAAAAKPKVTFQTAGGQAVTPALLKSKNLKTIPAEMVTLSQQDPKSLSVLIDSLSLVKSGDRRMGTVQGWNDTLWNKVKDRQMPAESLMDYQLWNASPDIEQEVVDLYRAQLVKMGAPPIVLDAFDASNTTGWYASTLPTPEDALAKMDIQAVMSGSVEGTVHEQRDFSISGAGQTPTYGSQTGEGTVTWDAPGLGLLTFKVDILLDKFDERGHAVGGKVTGVDAEKGYTVEITFSPDGTRKGEIKRYGKVVGQITMGVDESQFTNYMDLETNQSEPLPLP
jgi:hypothetical protein